MADQEYECIRNFFAHFFEQQADAVRKLRKPPDMAAVTVRFAVPRMVQCIDSVAPVDKKSGKVLITAGMLRESVSNQQHRSRSIERLPALIVK